MEPWTKKYLPKTASELVGQTTVLEKIKQYVQHYKGKKPLLLIGDPGIGKTAAAYVAAEELDLELLEINASDTRNKKNIEELLGAAAKQQSLFFKGRIILVDEVDGISGVKDRGGVSALVNIIKESGHPLVFIANEEHRKLKPLRKVCELVYMVPPPHTDVCTFLKHIAKKEQVGVSAEQISSIARQTGGDLRAAINDVQSFAGGDVSLLSEREHVEVVQQALLRIFKTTSAEVALPAFDNVAEDPSKLLLWIDENLPREYKKPEDLARGFTALAEADKFFGRIRKWQYYRYYVYIYNLLTAGIALAKEQKYLGVIEYKETTRLLKHWMYAQKNAKRKRLAEQLAPQLHTSAKRVRDEVLPFLKVLYKQKKGDPITKKYDLDQDAVAWFTK